VRLLRPVEFKRVFSAAERYRAGPLTLLASSNGLEHPRLGLAISKKSDKRAVQRNRIKRLVRESFRLHQAVIGAYDIVVMAKPGIATSSAPELRKALERVWRRMADSCDDC